MKPTKKGIPRIIDATCYSWKGLIAAFRHESAIREELLVGSLLVPVGIWLGQTAVEYALLFGALLLVFVVELLNSAIEAVVDRGGTEFHELAGRAKDMGSAAVMIALLNVFLIWGLIAWFRFT